MSTLTIHVASTQCGKNKKIENPISILKSLQSDHFVVIKQANINIYEDDNNEEHIPPRTFSGFKSACPVILEEENVTNRIPRVISTASLVSDGDRVHCRPVYRNVMFIERNANCNGELRQKLYEIKQKRVIVAYEKLETS